jgi:beta-N-acetylhexosaminidase
MRVGKRQYTVLINVLILLAGCGMANFTERGSLPAHSYATLVRPASTCVEMMLTQMNVEAKAAQLLMVGVPATGPSASDLTVLRAHSPAGVFLTGRSVSGVDATAQMIKTMRQQVGAATGLLVAADQEGGQVQVLSGPGFSVIPSATDQGRWSPEHLRAAARKWGSELGAAGVDIDLAPVADVLSAQLGRANAPIGRYDRAFGTNPEVVAEHATAVALGLTDAGIASAAKHFPGLGRANGNTDNSANVVDNQTTMNDPVLAPFQAAARLAPFMMVTTATYTKIDNQNRAAFSPVVLTGLLRERLEYRGLILSDDLGLAKEIAAVPIGQRAVRFIAAGGNILLTADPSTVAPMIDALAAQARAHEGFAQILDENTCQVLTVKAARGHGKCA